MKRSIIIRSAFGLVSGLLLVPAAHAAELSVSPTVPVVQAPAGSTTVVHGVITNPTANVVFLNAVSSDLTSAFATSNLFNEFFASAPDSLLPGESWEGPVVRLTVAANAQISSTHRVTVSFAGGDHRYDDQTLALFTFALNDSQAVAGVPGTGPSLPMGILGARPNPTRGPTEIAFQLATPAMVDVQVYDVRGTAIRSLIHGMKDAGLQTVNWDGRTSGGDAVHPGIYFVKLRAPGGVRMTKVVRIE